LQHDHAEVVVVPLDGFVENPATAMADMVDCCNQRGGEDRTGINLLGGHNANGKRSPERFAYA